MSYLRVNTDYSDEENTHWKYYILPFSSHLRLHEICLCLEVGIDPGALGLQSTIYATLPLRICC